MPIELYPNIVKVKRNGVYQNLPGFGVESADNEAQAMIANAETSTSAQYPHPEGSYFRLNGVLYQADENIRVNDIIAVGVNCHVAVLGDDVEENTKNIGELKNYAVSEGVKPVTIFREVEKISGYIQVNGVVKSSSSYYYFFLDNLVAGDKVIVKVYYQNTASIVSTVMRFICAYDALGNVVQSAGGESISSREPFVVPDGITKLAISITSTNPNIAEIAVIHPEKVTNLKTNRQISNRAFHAEPYKASGNMSASDRMEIIANSIHHDKSIAFTADITSFNSITIGQGKPPEGGITDSNSCFITVDDTNITLQSGSTQRVMPHGLTISRFIQVIIRDYAGQSTIGQWTIYLTTDDGVFSVNPISAWIGKLNNIYVETDESTVLTNCKLTIAYPSISNEVWIFGDSYISAGSTKWPHYVYGNNYKKFLLCGFGGESSPYAMFDLRELLKFGVPKIIVWCLGMNDQDQASAPNAMWNVTLEELKGIANEYDIDIVLATIPNTPSRSNIYKNNAVINSGFPYIDFATAVGATDANSTWYEGMLSDDNIHPTAEGAIALAKQVIKDFPYICNL